ncbi:MAG: hypothetical protein ABSE20_30605 [Acetobacteraceae bacterium]|jgi:hypothetical protein
MTSRSELRPLTQREQGDYGFARVRDQAFDAVQTLWRRRQAEGMRQKDIAAFLGRKPAWVSRNLSAPGNWTLRTFGEFMQALGGEAEITVHAVEDTVGGTRNHDAYDGYVGRHPGKLTHLA